MNKIKIKAEFQAERCEICHKADCFNKQLNYCSRCASVDFQKTMTGFPSIRQAGMQFNHLLVFSGLCSMFLMALLLIVKLPYLFQITFIWACFTIGGIYLINKVLSQRYQKKSEILMSNASSLYYDQKIRVMALSASAILGAIISLASFKYLILPNTLSSISNNDEECRGQINVVKSIIALGGDVNIAEKYGYTPLMIAAKEGSLDTVTKLIAAGANVNARNNNSETALMLASRENRNDIVTVLLNSGADVNATDNYGFSSLIWAAIGKKSNKLLTIKQLINFHVNVNQTIRNGENALIKMLYIYNMEHNNDPVDDKTTLAIVEELINAGINLDTISNSDDNSSSNSNQTALMIAADIGYFPIVQALLKGHANPNIKDKYGKTALMIAAHKHIIKPYGTLREPSLNIIGGLDLYTMNLEIVEALIESGTEVNSKTKLGETALMIAASEGKYNVVKLLARNNASINERTINGKTALMFAAEGGNRQVIKLLLDKGANINDKDNTGMSALMKSAYNGRDEAAEELINSGAKVKEVDNIGMTALVYAERGYRTGLVKLLKAAQ